MLPTEPLDSDILRHDKTSNPTPAPSKSNRTSRLKAWGLTTARRTTLSSALSSSVFRMLGRTWIVPVPRNGSEGKSIPYTKEAATTHDSGHQASNEPLATLHPFLGDGRVREAGALSLHTADALRKSNVARRLVNEDHHVDRLCVHTFCKSLAERQQIQLRI